jgi:hypothetical protein
VVVLFADDPEPKRDVARPTLTIEDDVPRTSIAPPPAIDGEPLR